jgi:fatty acid desaturase
MKLTDILLTKVNAYAMNAAARMRQLQWGTGIFFIGVIIVYIASTLLWQWLFYCGAVIMIGAAAYTFPAYLALIYWRLFGKR